MPSFAACSHLINARKRAALPEADAVANAADIELGRATVVAEKIWLEALKHDTETAKDLAGAECGEAEFKEIFVEHVCSFSLQGLQQAISSWRRWVKHCEEKGNSPTKISKTLLAVWLKTCKKGGRTAPRSALAALKKMCYLVGIVIDADHGIVKGQTACAAANVEEPAVPLSINTWAWLEQALQSPNMFTRSLALAWILMLNGTLRFAHLQRSMHISTRKGYMEFKAYAGKAKTEGMRKPMSWTVPSITLTGVDLVEIVNKHMKDKGEVLSKADFWLPDFGPSRVNLANVKTLEGRPMSISRFMKFSMELFAGGGIQECEISQISTYSARRVLPTIADASSLTPTERVKIGSWTDSTGKLEKTKKQLQMPDRYSDKYLMMQAKAKAKTIISARIAWEAVKDHGLSASMTWEDVLPHVPNPRKLNSAVAAVFS